MFYQTRPCLGCSNIGVSSGYILCPACQLVAEVRIDHQTGQLGLAPRNAIPLEVMMARAAAVLQALSPSPAMMTELPTSPDQPTAVDPDEKPATSVA